MKKRIQHLLLAIIIAISIFPFVATSTDAANLTAMSDTMSRLKAATVANHEINFTTPSGIDAGETITITFPATFASGLDGVAFGDMDLEDDGVDLALAATPSGATWGAAVATRTITFTSGTGTIAATSVITVEIGLNATFGVAGDTQITNSASGSQTISIAGTFGDTGSFAVAIMTEDQVTVSATVDPSITSTLSASTCALGTLDSSSVQTCQYTNTVNTNAGSGYAATILDDGNLRSGANDINDAGVDNDVDQGSEEYGVGTSDNGQTIIENDDCDDPGDDPEPAAAITTSAQQYASATGPVTNEATTLCHAASIAGATPAGSYQHIVTHITTGTF